LRHADFRGINAEHVHSPVIMLDPINSSLALHETGPSFRDLAFNHLAQYKADVLGVREDGLPRYRSQDTPKSLILPIAHREANILERYRAQFWSSNYAKIRLHRSFHHLNSSQALCINLFYPLIAEHALGFFLQFLGIAPDVELEAFFEIESDIELAARRTAFDFSIQLAAKGNIFVEVKYTEDGFGRTKKDDAHRAKFQKTYLPLIENSPFFAPECKKEEFFLNHYQILRNLVHISDTDRVVLLFPPANTVVAEEAVYARDRLLTDAGRIRLSLVSLDEIVSFLEHQFVGGPLDGYYQVFRSKYLPQGKGAARLGQFESR
jgi:hypothetical protein